jgi:hypothetical protein
MEFNFEFFSTLHEVTASNSERAVTPLNAELKALRQRNEARAKAIREQGMTAAAGMSSKATVDLK